MGWPSSPRVRRAVECRSNDVGLMHHVGIARHNLIPVPVYPDSRGPRRRWAPLVGARREVVREPPRRPLFLVIRTRLDVFNTLKRVLFLPAGCIILPDEAARARSGTHQALACAQPSTTSSGAIMVPVRSRRRDPFAPGADQRSRACDRKSNVGIARQDRVRTQCGGRGTVRCAASEVAVTHPPTRPFGGRSSARRASGGLASIFVVILGWVGARPRAS